MEKALPEGRTQALTRVSEVDWESWRPDDDATLLFVIRDEEVLLIRKKRGLGAGKINAPGGRLEPGESAEVAAVREVEEEVCVTPLGIESRGSLCFEFCSGYKLRAYVFVAHDFRGSPTETDEAIPGWFRMDELPFDEMWADDRLWVPHVLSGRSVRGRFIFDDEAMRDYVLEVAF